MAAAVLRLFLLVALALMPMGMTSAPAAGSVATPAAGHCDDHEQPADAPTKADMHCATCTALPAIEAPVGDPGLRPEMPRFARAASALSNTEPEIATPPPRLS
jgi:hypothetical protein